MSFSKAHPCFFTIATLLNKGYNVDNLKVISIYFVKQIYKVRKIREKGRVYDRSGANN